MGGNFGPDGKPTKLDPKLVYPIDSPSRSWSSESFSTVGLRPSRYELEGEDREGDACLSYLRAESRHLSWENL